MRVQTTSVMSAAVAATGVLAASASATPAVQSFGALSYPGGPGGTTPISWVWPISGQSDNTNFLYTNTNIGTGGTDRWLTIGLRANAYYGAPNEIPTYARTNTFAVQPGASLWTPAPGAEPDGYTNAPQWGFSWSISVNGSRDNAAIANLFWSLRIEGPGSSGNWGTVAAGGAVTNSGSANSSLNAWQLGFDFFRLSSGETPINPNDPLGPKYPAGLWDGLNFNRNQLGEYRFTLAVRNGDPEGDIVGQTVMNVFVPGPGAVALLGVAGLGGSRRRRS